MHYVMGNGPGRGLPPRKIDSDVCRNDGRHRCAAMLLGSYQAASTINICERLVKARRESAAPAAEQREISQPRQRAGFKSRVFSN